MVRFVPYSELAVKLPTRCLWHGPGRQVVRRSCGGNRLDLIRHRVAKVTLSGCKSVKRIIGWWFILFQLIGRCGCQRLQQAGIISLLLALIPSGASAQQAEARAQSQSAADHNRKRNHLRTACRAAGVRSRRDRHHSKPRSKPNSQRDRSNHKYRHKKKLGELDRRVRKI